MSVQTILLLLITYFNEMPRSMASDDWFTTRQMWQARNLTDRTDVYKPLRLVIVTHTATPECTVTTCASEMRLMQSYYIDAYNYDIPYNFVIGNDGRVYEGRGWNIVGAHTLRYNDCSLGLAFIGDYREGKPTYSKVTALQESRAHMLLDEGVEMGYLHPYFEILAASDIRPTLSPGENLYKTIQKWPRYDHKNRYKNLTCEQIKELSFIKPIAGASLQIATPPLLALCIISILNFS